MQTLIRGVSRYFALSVAFFALSCSFFDKQSGPALQVIVGDVTHTRDGESQPAVQGKRLKPQDAVAVGRGAKLKVAAGPSGIYVNEESSFKVLTPAPEESCAVIVDKGEFYFSARDGAVLVGRFGDVNITMAEADVSLAIDQSGRSAYLFVLSGSIKMKRGKAAETTVAACNGVVIDAAGITEDYAAANNYRSMIARFKGWVGETVVERAAFLGKCRTTEPVKAPVAELEEKLDTALVVLEEVVPVPPPPVKKKAAPSRPRPQKPVDTVVAVAPPPPPPPPPPPEEPVEPVVKDSVFIEYIVGPRQVYVNEEFTMKCQASGNAKIAGYVWKIRVGDEYTEYRTEAPQITASLKKAGEYLVICEVIGDGGAALAAQQVRIQILPVQFMIKAGGPYSAVRGKPMRLLGNARSRGSDIVRYEWYITSQEKPDAAFAENAIVQHIFASAGQHKAVFLVRLADGTVARDTAIVNVTTEGPPTAKTGADVVSVPGRKVKLSGIGSSPGSKIVKYEWDFDGNGAYDWSSETSGTVEYAFKEFSRPVFKVTDGDGYTAFDTMRVVICPKEMVTVAGGKFCIDKYEWPNKRGAAPRVNVSWQEAAQTCESAGKRLCTANEWRRACRNDSDTKPVDGRTYSYGNVYDKSKCHVTDNPRSKNGVREAGSFSDCAGSLSIFDMSGNAAEWVASSDAATARAYGGFYQSGAEESDCDSFITIDKNAVFPYTGFRCCK